MATNIDLELTNEEFQIVVTKPEDFFDAELEVATVGLDVMENSVETLLEQEMRIMCRRRPNPNCAHPKELIDHQIIDEKAISNMERLLDCRERLAGLKGAKKVKIQRMA